MGSWSRGGGRRLCRGEVDCGIEKFSGQLIPAMGSCEALARTSVGTKTVYDIDSVVARSRYSLVSTFYAVFRPYAAVARRKK